MRTHGKTHKGDKHQHDDDDGGDKKKPSREEPKLGNPGGDPVRIHREYVERRLGGGPPATREAYARALQQWRKLPGAVTTSPTEISGDEEVAPEKKDDDASPKTTPPGEEGKK